MDYVKIGELNSSTTILTIVKVVNEHTSSPTILGNSPTPTCMLSKMVVHTLDEFSGTGEDTYA